MYEELDKLTYDSLIRWDKKKLVNFTLSLLEEQKKLKPRNLIHPGNGCLSSIFLFLIYFL